MTDEQRRNLLRLPIHFVWATHQRLPLISEDIERRLYHYIETICEKHRCPVLAIGGMPDHVHLLVALSNTCTVSDLIKQVKGSSSRFITETLKPDAWFAWQPNYAAIAVSPRDKNSVIAYIQNQKKRHAEADLWLDAEQTDEPLSPEDEETLE